MLHTVKDHKYINSYADYLGYPDATILNGGKAIAKTGKKLLGVKTPKGSRAAKIKMAYLRSLRGGAFADDLQEALRRRRRFIADEDEIPEADSGGYSDEEEEEYYDEPAPVLPPRMIPPPPPPQPTPPKIKPRIKGIKRTRSEDEDVYQVPFKRPAITPKSVRELQETNTPVVPDQGFQITPTTQKLVEDMRSVGAQLPGKILEDVKGKTGKDVIKTGAETVASSLGNAITNFAQNPTNVMGLVQDYGNVMKNLVAKSKEKAIKKPKLNLTESSVAECMWWLQEMYPDKYQMVINSLLK